MQLRQMTVSPDLARKWLAASEGVKQRNLSRARVDRYAHDMARGQWQLTHQAIALTSEGVILDGQHRLAAVVQAGIPQTFLVARGADHATFDVIDQGRPRNTADTLRISGMSNVNMRAAIGRQVLVYDGIKGTTGASRRIPITSPDILALWEGPRGPLLAEGLQMGMKLGAQLDRSGVKTWGASLWVVLTESRAALDKRLIFFEQVGTGAELPQGSAILAFRRWILANTGVNSLLTQDRPLHFLANGIKTWNDWTTGKERQTTVWKQGREAMPLITAGPSQPKLEEAVDHD